MSDRDSVTSKIPISHSQLAGSTWLSSTPQKTLSPLNPCNALYQTLPNPTNTHRQAICGFSKNMWCGNAVLTCLFCCVCMRNCGSVPKPSNCLAVYHLHECSILTEKKKKLLRLGYVYVTRHGKILFFFFTYLIFFHRSDIVAQNLHPFWATSKSSFM